MSMRTLECNRCGEPLTGHDDEALARRLREHMRDVHSDTEYDEAAARDEVAADAYTATDN